MRTDGSLDPKCPFLNVLSPTDGPPALSPGAKKPINYTCSVCFSRELSRFFLNIEYLRVQWKVSDSLGRSLADRRPHQVFRNCCDIYLLRCTGVIKKKRFSEIHTPDGQCARMNFAGNLISTDTDEWNNNNNKKTVFTIWFGCHEQESTRFNDICEKRE